MNRPSRTSVVANPVLVGAVTTLVVVVAVFLAYNANSGLPFVPTYDVRVAVPDAAQLVAGNEVRIAGTRVGQVNAIDARWARDGSVSARLTLKLEQDAGPLPVDSEVVVRQQSNLGLKYLQIIPGRSRRTIPAGGSLRLDRARPVVDLDDVLNSFDRETRRAARGTVHELGTALTGRGADLNRALAELSPTLARLAPVMDNLADRRTDLAGAIRGLRAASSTLAPVSRQLTGLVDGAAVTLAAVARARGGLGAALEEGPRVTVAGTRALRGIRPPLDETTALLGELRPGLRALPPAALRVTRALSEGGPVLRRVPPLAARAEGSLRALGQVARDPARPGALRELTAVVASLARTLEFANPFQTRCNYLGLWTRNVPSVVSEGDGYGTWFRFIAIVKPDEILPATSAAPDLHVNPYPDEGQDGQCEPGNEVWRAGRQIGPVPGRQPGETESTRPPAEAVAAAARRSPSP